MVVAVVRSKYAVARSPVQTRLELCTGIVGIMVIGRRPASPIVAVIILSVSGICTQPERTQAARVAKRSQIGASRLILVRIVGGIESVRAECA